MLPLKISSLFESASGLPSASGSSRAPARPAANGASKEALSWPDIERRQTEQRRQNDRRESQQAILLNTRRPQGRRRTPGRRDEDRQASPALHISIKS